MSFVLFTDFVCIDLTLFPCRLKSLMICSSKLLVNICSSLGQNTHVNLLKSPYFVLHVIFGIICESSMSCLLEREVLISPSGKVTVLSSSDLKDNADRDQIAENY